MRPASPGVLAVSDVACAEPPPSGPMSLGGALRAEGDIPGAIAVETDPTLAPPTDPDLVTARDDKGWAAVKAVCEAWGLPWMRCANM